MMRRLRTRTPRPTMAMASSSRRGRLPLASTSLSKGGVILRR